jgi:uncharacterized protein (TIGR02246 family)
MAALGTDRRNLIAYPTNRVVGTLGDADRAQAAIGALLKAGFNEEDIDVLHGEGDVERLGASGVAHGFLAQFRRTLTRTFDFDEFKHLTHHVEDVRAGRYVVMVLTKRRAQRILAGDILHQHGARFVGFYGRWAWEGLHAAGPQSPQDMPESFVAAWNARDSVALAALFDEDAEFVNATGLACHGRESIRRAHAHDLQHIANRSLLALDAVKVKLLAPEVALVHARLTLSCEPGADAATSHEPRTTIVTFVVHRVLDRWQCVSAHNTDVTPKPATPLVAEGGAVALGNYSSDPVS